MEYAILGNAGLNFPSVITLSCDGLAGYLNPQSIVNDVIAILVLRPPEGDYDRDGNKVYDLIYELQESRTWPLPFEMT